MLPWRGLVLALGVVACGPDEIVLEPPIEPAALEDVCGAPSPFLLLSLAPDEAPVPSPTAITRIGDRVYFAIGSVFDRGLIDDTNRLVSTGPCGEDPRDIATNIVEVFEHERWPGRLLGHTTDQDVVVLDPLGEQAPRTLITNVHLHQGWTPHGIVDVEIIDAFTARLILRPYPVGPDDADLAPTVLLDPYDGSYSFVALEDEVVLTNAGDIQTLDLVDGSRTIEVEDVVLQRITADGRFVVWMTDPQLSGLPDFHVFDRDTGVSTLIGEDGLRVDIEDSALLLLLGDEDLGAFHRIIALPGLQHIDTPVGVHLMKAIDERTWIASRDTASFVIFDSATGTTDVLFDRFGAPSVLPDRLQIYEEQERDRPFDPYEGELFEVSYATRETKRVASRVSPDFVQLAGGTVVTAIDRLNSLGTLAFTDAEGITRWSIDDDVVRRFGDLQARAGYPGDVVVYAVSAPDRSGVYLARLPAH